jgi:hypothetical protein
MTVLFVLCAAACVAADTGAGDAGGEDAQQTDARPSGDAAPEQRFCSGDLHNIVNSTGQVLEACAPSGGCLDAACVSPCEAAGGSHGRLGCEYMVATPHFWEVTTPPCLALFVANAWSAPTKLTVTREGEAIDVSIATRLPTSDPDPTTWPLAPAGEIPPGEVGVVFLSHDPYARNSAQSLACPVTPAVSTFLGTAVADTARGAAFAIESDVPITLYDILPFGGALSALPSADTVIPITAWGTNYVLNSPQPSVGTSWIQVIAAEDDTEVTMAPTSRLSSGPEVPGGMAGELVTLTLDAGEYVQWETGGDPAGSVLSTNNPVAVVVGDTYQCFESATSTGGGCDSGHQQLSPVRALAHSYVAAPYPTRRSTGAAESIHYRLVGIVDATELVFDPPNATAPTSVNAGEVIDFESSEAFVVSSQDQEHPFEISQSMSGCHVSDEGPSCLGDEEVIEILPPEQFLRRYLFFSDPSYGTTQLVVTRAKTSTGFKEVSLDCMGTLSGWMPVGTTEGYEYTTVNIAQNGAGIGACNNGVQSASSEGPFGVTIWGLAAFASYAYQAGGNVSPINAVVVPAVID